ncbi:unnamed protein product [Didymodactylos carnosus]|uniref:Uncharacterized protein n=1 Tax=Didymodactylos carnosus TaxID=1234261 RepID=A0A8S2HRM7_9BILA|nr:unnamed protein product [Didymodactylos carnosus]CAF3679165.1 unnamed protein product [Didymodactylos carnosus]
MSDIIVSFTSCSGRFRHELPLTIHSLLSQTILPKEIRLYLSTSDRNLTNKSIIKQDLINIDHSMVISELYNKLVHIYFVPDRGPATKFMSILEEYDKSNRSSSTQLIFVCDDDHYYQPHMLATLLFYNRLFKNDTIGFRGWRIRDDLIWGVIGKPEGYYHIIDSSNILQPYRVGIVTANWGYLIQPKFFDKHIYSDYNDLTERISLVDDIWINAHLARRHIARYVVPSCCYHLSITKLRVLDTKLSNKQLSRAQANNNALKYFRQYWEKNLYYKFDGINHPVYAQWYKQVYKTIIFKENSVKKIPELTEDWPGHAGFTVNAMKYYSRAKNNLFMQSSEEFVAKLEAKLERIRGTKTNNKNLSGKQFVEELKAKREDINRHFLTSDREEDHQLDPIVDEPAVWNKIEPEQPCTTEELLNLVENDYLDSKAKNDIEEENKTIAIEKQHPESMDEHQSGNDTNFIKERIRDILKRQREEYDDDDDNENKEGNDSDDPELDELFSHVFPSATSDEYRESLANEEEDDHISDEESDDRENNYDNDESEQNESLYDELLHNNNENIDHLWNCLTNDEKAEFDKMINDGRISCLLNDYKPWKPWWLYRCPLLTDISSTINNASDSVSDEIPNRTPLIIESIIPLPSLTSILPHVHVRFDLFEILFSYVFICVRYRGDHQSYSNDAGSEFFYLASRHLNTSHQQQSAISGETTSVLNERITLLRQHLNHMPPMCRISQKFFIDLLKDIIAILHGPYKKQSSAYVTSALSDIKRFLTKLIEDQRKPTPAATTIDEVEQDESEKSKRLSISNVFHMHKKNDQTKQSNKTRTAGFPKRDTKLNDNNRTSIIRPKIEKRAIPTTNAITKDKNKSCIVTDRKTLMLLSKKIDYLLSWSVTHTDRIKLLEFEMKQIEEELRCDFEDYQSEKRRIEKNLENIRLKTAKQANLIEEL